MSDRAIPTTLTRPTAITVVQIIFCLYVFICFLRMVMWIGSYGPVDYKITFEMIVINLISWVSFGLGINTLDQPGRMSLTWAKGFFMAGMIVPVLAVWRITGEISGMALLPLVTVLILLRKDVRAYYASLPESE